MIADGLTKPLQNNAFQQFSEQVGLADIAQHLQHQDPPDSQEVEAQIDIIDTACSSKAGPKDWRWP